MISGCKERGEVVQGEWGEKQEKKIGDIGRAKERRVVPNSTL